MNRIALTLSIITVCAAGPGALAQRGGAGLKPAPAGETRETPPTNKGTGPVSAPAPAARPGPPPPAPMAPEPVDPPPPGVVEVGPDGVPIGYTVINGDIQVRDSDLMLDGTFGPVNYWWVNNYDDAVVPYEFNNDFTVPQAPAVVTGCTASMQQQAISAMGRISAVSGVTFRPRRASDGSWVQFRNSTGNNSPVGRQGGMQIINIINWGTEYKICHEMMHSLGWWHEHTRPDRDQYVTINTGALQNGNGVAAQFSMQTNANVWGPYDFDSVMHYDACGFSNCCAAGSTCNCSGNPACLVIIANPPYASWQNAMGQRDHLSFLDRTTLRGVYPVPGDRWLNNLWAGPQEGTNIFRPWNTTFAAAVGGTPSGGRLFVNPSYYSAVGTYSRPMTIEAPLGGTTLGN